MSHQNHPSTRPITFSIGFCEPLGADVVNWHYEGSNPLTISEKHDGFCMAKEWLTGQRTKLGIPEFPKIRLHFTWYYPRWQEVKEFRDTLAITGAGIS